MRYVIFRSSLFLVCIAIAISAAGQSKSSTTGVIKGKIVDSYHARISRAFVLVHGSGADDRKAEVDDQGRFTVELPAGIHDVFVSSNGFDPACRKIEVQPGKTSVYNVQLRANTIGFEY
jgi:hypothetical protein